MPERDIAREANSAEMEGIQDSEVGSAQKLSLGGDHYDRDLNFWAGRGNVVDSIPVSAGFTA